MPAGKRSRNQDVSAKNRALLNLIAGKGGPGRFCGVKVNSSLRCGPVDRIANVVVAVGPRDRSRVISRAPS